MPTNNPRDDITGRDFLIINEALATAYALIGSLPERCRSLSDMNDMRKLLKARLGEGWKFQAHIVRHALSEDDWRDRKPMPGDPFPEEG
jgi:hypothetical protein